MLCVSEKDHWVISHAVQNDAFEMPNAGPIRLTRLTRGRKARFLLLPAAMAWPVGHGLNKETPHL